VIKTSQESAELEGASALFYTALWQTRELGFLKKILTDLKIKKLKILIFFEEYKPGALITLDGEFGDYKVESIDSPDDVEYDGAIIGKLKPLVEAMEGHLISKGLWAWISGKVKLKGKRNLWKFAKVLLRCAI
jgi:hypothetical protein